MNETSTLALPDDPKLQQEFRVVAEALAVSLGVKELSPEFSTRRDEATAAIYEFTKPPTTDEEQAAILSVQRQASKLRTELTKNGAALRGPLNAAKTRISDLENTAVAVLKKAEEHAQGLVNHRQQKLLEERREAEAAAQRETQRIAAEQAAAIKAQADAEKARQQAQEAAQRAEEAKGKEKVRAEAEALRLAQEAQKAEDEAFEKQMEAEAAPVLPIVPVSELPQAKTIRDFEIIGRTPSEQKASLIKLLCAKPEFFSATIKSETPRTFSLSLKIADLMDALCGREPFQKLESTPGIQIHERLSTLR